MSRMVGQLCMRLCDVACFHSYRRTLRNGGSNLAQTFTVEIWSKSTYCKAFLPGSIAPHSGLEAPRFVKTKIAAVYTVHCTCCAFNHPQWLQFHSFVLSVYIYISIEHEAHEETYHNLQLRHHQPTLRNKYVRSKTSELVLPVVSSAVIDGWSVIYAFRSTDILAPVHRTLPQTEQLGPIIHTTYEV